MSDKFEKWIASDEGPRCCACPNDAKTTWNTALEEAAKVLDNAARMCARMSIVGFYGGQTRRNHMYLAEKIRELKTEI